MELKNVLLSNQRVAEEIKTKTLLGENDATYDLWVSGEFNKRKETILKKWK